MDDRRIPSRLHPHRPTHTQRNSQRFGRIDRKRSDQLDQLHNAPMGIRRTTRVYTTHNGLDGFRRTLRRD